MIKIANGIVSDDFLLRVDRAKIMLFDHSNRIYVYQVKLQFFGFIDQSEKSREKNSVIYLDWKSKV